MGWFNHQLVYLEMGEVLPSYIPGFFHKPAYIRIMKQSGVFMVPVTLWVLVPLLRNYEKARYV